MALSSERVQDNLPHDHQSSSPISVLPPEILPIIFFEALQVSRTKSKAIFTISWVSHLWRGIALSTPDLWTLIDTLDMEVIQTLMARAKGRPLSIALKDVKSDNRQPIVTLLESLHSIRFFSLSVYYYTDWTRMAPFPEMSNPAPLLETLDLNGIFLPENLFSGALPSLRHLSLEAFGTGVEVLPHCPQLRSYSLRHPELRIQPQLWLERLATFPLLERVEAVALFEHDSGASIRLQDPIKLPHLQLLFIEGEDMRNVAPLLEHLRIPRTCKVSLEVHQHQPDQHLRLFPILSTCRAGPMIAVRKVKINAEGWLSVKIYEGQKKPHFAYDAALSRRSTFSFTIWPAGPRSGSIPLATKLLQEHIPLNHLDTLDLLSRDVDTANHPPTSFWELVDSSLSNLRSLRVRQIYAASFIQYISATLALQSTDTSRPRVPFSQVAKFVYEDPCSNVEGYPTRLDALIRYLRLRADNGLAVSRLTLVDVKKHPRPIPKEVLDELRSLVREVKRKMKSIILDKAKLVDFGGGQM